jgi:hypothetical protein
MRTLVKDVATTGAAGSATGSVDFQAWPGEKLTAVGVDYLSAPATTVVTVTNPDVPGATTLTIPAGNTDRLVRPRLPVHDAAGNAITGRGEEPPLVEGRITVAVSAANAASPAARVRLYLG